MILTGGASAPGAFERACEPGLTGAGTDGDLRWWRETGSGAGRRRRLAHGSGLGFGVNAQVNDGLLDGEARGLRQELGTVLGTVLGLEHKRALAEVVEQAPILASQGLVGWWIVDQTRWLFDERGVPVNKQTPEPGHACDGLQETDGAAPAPCAGGRGHRRSRKDLPARRSAIKAALPCGTAMDLWWQDEARDVRKNGIASTGRRAKRGTRPSAPKDQRTTPAHICGAVCPAEGKGAGLVLPRCNIAGLTLRRGKISAVAARAPMPRCPSIRRGGTA